MLFFLYCLFTVFIFVQKGQFILVPRGGFIVQVVVVDVFLIRLFPGTVHLQIDLFIVVLEFQSRDKVLSLEVTLGEVVHGLRVPLLVSLLPDVAYYHHHHAEKHQGSHQAYSQNDGCQAQLIGAYVGAGSVGGRHDVELAPGAAVMVWADAAQPAFRSGGASPAVEARLRGTVVRWSVAVATRVPWGAGAGVVVDAVDAGGAVCAGVPGAFVNVALTAETSEARATAAHLTVPVAHTMATYAGEIT